CFRLLTLPVSQRNFRCSRFAFLTSNYCLTVCNVVPSSTCATIGARVIILYFYSSCSLSFVDGYLIILR
ncbi:hypothetical protein DFH08DRAFT_848364, partial [Mycena albidolilacea]